MSNYVKTLVALIILFCTSCAQNPGVANNGMTIPPGESPALDSGSAGFTKNAGINPNDLVAKSAVRIDTNAPILQKWEKSLRDRGKNFNLRNFYAASMRTIDVGDCNTWDGREMYDCACSPDSTLYATTVPGWCGDEPDTYVYLFNTKNNTWCELASAGTFTTYEDCEWQDNSTLIVYGYDSYDAEQKYPDQDYVQGFYVVYDFTAKKAICYASKNYFRLK